MSNPVRWGVLGASNFARKQMARAIHAAEGAEFAALATSSEEKAKGFQAFAPNIQVYSDYDALLADPSIEAVYIPLPNHLHVEWTLKAIDAGKHVLCEKPLALKAESFDELIAKRDQTGLLVAEAYMIVHHPQWIKAREIVQGGQLGRIRHVDGIFTYDNRGALENIRNRPETGGGAIPDIGVYPYGAVRYVLGAEPSEIRADIDFENGVDTYSHVTGRFGQTTISLIASMRMANRQSVTFHGEKGRMTLPAPFNPMGFDQAEIEIETQLGTTQVERFPDANHYVNQVENFGRTLREGTDYPCPLEFSCGTQAMIDQVYASAQNT